MPNKKIKNKDINNIIGNVLIFFCLIVMIGGIIVSFILWLTTKNLISILPGIVGIPALAFNIHLISREKTRKQE